MTLIVTTTYWTHMGYFGLKCWTPLPITNKVSWTIGDHPPEELQRLIKSILRSTEAALAA